MKKCPSFCDPVAVEAEHPMFIMYTSGTTAGSTGIRHSTAGYLLYVALTHKVVYHGVLSNLIRGGVTSFQGVKFYLYMVEPTPLMSQKTAFVYVTSLPEMEPTI